jgi:membrane protease YdiL (CAAX protease family)
MNALSSVMKRHDVLLDFVLIFLCTWSIDLTIAAQDRGWLPTIIPSWLGIFVGFGFVIAALVATSIVEGWAGIRALLRRYLIWRVGVVWFAVVLLGPVLIDLTAIGMAWLAGGAAPSFNQPFVRQVLDFDPSMSLGLLALIWFLFEILTNCEEIGWRGYSLPRLLARHNALVASLILGVVWAIWHLPKFWMGGVTADAHGFPFWVFGLNIVALSVLYTWVYKHTHGSLLLATLFHAAINTSFMILPIPDGELASYLAIGLRWLCVVLVVLMTGSQLARRTGTFDEITQTQGALPLV